MIIHTIYTYICIYIIKYPCNSECIKFKDMIICRMAGRTDVSRNGISGIYPKYEPLAARSRPWLGCTGQVVTPCKNGKVWKSQVSNELFYGVALYPNS
jgi:hypothetical protein